MKHFTFQSFSSFIRETGDILLRALRSLRTLNWMQLLAVCLGLSLLIAIVPLALGLFLLVLIVKFAMGLFAPRKKAMALLTIENGDQP